MALREPVWLNAELLIELNRTMVTAHGGAAAQVRDTNLLGSALARPRHLHAYATRTPAITDLAAAYGFGLVRNHAFVDGNKRTALLAVYTFLNRNGTALVASAASLVVAIEHLACGDITETDFASFLADNTKPFRRRSFV